MSPALARPAVWVASGLVSVMGLVALGGGAVLVLDDMTSRTDMFDGLGVALGLLLGGLGVVVLGVAGLAVWLAPRHPLGAGIVLCVFGVLVAGVGVLAVPSMGASVAAPFVLGGLLVGGIGFGAAVGASSETIDSPGGYPQ